MKVTKPGQHTLVGPTPTPQTGGTSNSPVTPAQPGNLGPQK
jgi:hypothetical protein